MKKKEKKRFKECNFTFIKKGTGIVHNRPTEVIFFEIWGMKLTCFLFLFSIYIIVELRYIQEISRNRQTLQ